VPPFKQWREFLVLSLILTLSIMTQFFCSADLLMILEDRVAAVGIATQFQEHSNQVLKMVEEETEYAKTQVPCSNYLSCELALQSKKFRSLCEIKT
jgi:magnesium chelatase subunit D